MKHTQRAITPFEIKQVGIVVRDREKVMQQFSSLLGTGPFRLLDLDQPEAIVHGKRTHCGAKLAFAQAGPIEIELIEPVEGESTWSEFLRAKGEGVHHLGIWVPDINKELARFTEMGIGTLQSGEDKHVRFAYMDTEGIAGVIIELLQSK
jgi:methylmalonyl-CoA/ethylmalonyl-CoA epimerase